jgi:transposase InsO family protein
MPWKETCAMDQRVQFIGAWLSGRHSKSALCRHFGISRPTGEKWIRRHERLGVDGLKERSRAPHSQPNRVSEALCERIVQVKLEHLDWGPKKVLDWLRAREPEVVWPADSTGGEILRRAGLVKARRRRRAVPPHEAPFADCEQSNALWAVDFKGDYRLGGVGRCYPLTLSDSFSRYLLLCRGLAHPSAAAVRPWFEWAFREYGLPQAIRSDNGAPFASRAVGGLSALSKWWIDLGIRPQRIRPGRPDQNGRHERMHRSLKGWLGAAAKGLEAEQRRLEAFRAEYNWERSHEALGRRTPGSLYAASPRPYPLCIEPPAYEQGVVVRQVRSNGEIKWRGRLIYLSEVLIGEPVALEPAGDGLWELRYRFHPLGLLNEQNDRITPARGWHGDPKV